MTFNDFIPLIHKGVNGSFYLVDVGNGGCITCKGRYDLLATLRQNDMLSDMRYKVVGIQPYRHDAIIIEYEKEM